MIRQEKVVIWDLDGTILDSFGIFEDGLAMVLPKYDIVPPTRQVLLANFHGSLEESIGNTLGHPDAQVLQGIVRDFLAAQDLQHEDIEPHIFADVYDIAQHFKEAGALQVLVTNRAHEGRLRASPRHIVAHTRLRDYIEIVICGDDGEHCKPDVRVLGRHSDLIIGKDLLVVGDQFVDAQFALNLGAKAFIVNRSGEQPHHLEKLPIGWEDHIQVVSSLDRLKSHFAEEFLV